MKILFKYKGKNAFQIGQRPREFVTTISELIEIWRNFFRLIELIAAYVIGNMVYERKHHHQKEDLLE